MPSPRTIGIGFTLPCGDHEKIVWRLVRETISSAVNVSTVSAIVINGLLMSLNLLGAGAGEAADDLVDLLVRVHGGVLDRTALRRAEGTSAREIVRRQRDFRRVRGVVTPHVVQ